LNETAPGGGNTPVASPTSVTAFGGNLYIGTHAAILLLPINVDGSVTLPTLPDTCQLPTSTNSCTIDVVPQTPVASVAFNNGFAYVSGNGNGGNGGIGVCTLESNGILDSCATDPANPATPAFYGGLAVH
jgi:hypothetical protein